LTVTAYSYLEIVANLDGADESVLIMSSTGAATDYQLKWGGWGPRIAQLKTSLLGFPYPVVTEEWTLNIRGSTAAIALANYEKLIRLIEQGFRWWKKREIAQPPVLRYQIKGSDLSTYQKDVITGFAREPKAPDDFTKVGDFYWIMDVRIAFFRKNGLWLGATDTQSSSTFTCPGPNALTFTTTHVKPCPVKVTITPSASPFSGSLSGVIAFSNEASHLIHVEGRPIASGGDLTGTTNVTDTTNLATNSAIGRVAATTTEGNFSYTSTLAAYANGDHVAIYANLKNSSTTVNVIIRPEVSIGGNTMVLPEVTILAKNPANPQVVFLGIFPTNGKQLDTITFYYRTVSGSINIDIDYLGIFLINAFTTIIAIPALTNSVGTVIDHRLLTHPTPFVGNASVNASLYNYTGNPYVFQGGYVNGTEPIAATDLAVFLMLTQGSFWRPANAAGTAAHTFVWSADRTIGYLVPR